MHVQCQYATRRGESPQQARKATAKEDSVVLSTLIMRSRHRWTSEQGWVQTIVDGRKLGWELDMLAMAAPTKPLPSGSQLHHHSHQTLNHHPQQHQQHIQHNQSHYHHQLHQHHQSVTDICLQNTLAIPSSSSCDPTLPSSSEISSSSCSPTTSDILRGIKAASMNDSATVRLLQQQVQQVKTEPFDIDYTQAMMPLHLGFSSNGHCPGQAEVLLHSRSSTETPSVSRRRSAQDGMIKCLFCPKKAVNQAALEAHIQECRVLRCHECGQCGKRFKARGGLQQHMRIHNNDKPYACNFCNKKFTQKSHVDQHERIHTGAKPFTCQYCGRAFRQRSQQLGHESTHGNQASGSGSQNNGNNNGNNQGNNDNMQRNAENRVPRDPAPSSSEASQQFSNLQRSMPPQQQLEHCVSTQAVTNLLALSQQHQQLQENSLHSGSNLNQNGMGLGVMTSAAACLQMNQMNMNPYSMQHSSLLNHMI